MSSIAFNNLRFSKKLTDSGMPQQQADVLAESIHEITTSIENNFATKKDLEKLVTKDELKLEMTTLKYEMTNEIKTEVRRVEQRVEQDIHELKANVKVLNWMMGFLMAGVGSLVMKAFF